MDGKKVCVIGGGNIGSYVAVQAKKIGCYVSLLVSNKSKFSGPITVIDNDLNTCVSADIDYITSDIKNAVLGYDYIFVTYPSFMFSDLDEKIHEYVDENTTIVVLPGSGGAEFSFSKCIKKGVHFFGLQRVPVIARLKEYGKSVNVSGKKAKLFLGSINSSEEIVTRSKVFLEELFGIDVVCLPNYLCVTLTPSNPVLHTTRLFSMLKDYKPGVVYSKNPLFYEDWDDQSSSYLFKCDAELQKLCKAISDLDLSSVVSLPLYYESKTESLLTKKIKSIPAFFGIKAPYKEVENGFVPDFSSRYFTADFPYGLKILIEIGRIFEIETPIMNEIWEWYKNITKCEKYFSLKISKSDFISLYK